MTITPTRADGPTVVRMLQPEERKALVDYVMRRATISPDDQKLRLKIERELTQVDFSIIDRLLIEMRMHADGVAGPTYEYNPYATR